MSRWQEGFKLINMSDPDPSIFVVDDDDDVRTSIVRTLSMRGYSVQEFGSATEFLKRYNGQAGCLLLDYDMPEMNGLELQERLFEDGKLLPIVFITGRGGVPESVQAIKRGATDFLEKPVVTKVLLKCVDNALAKGPMDDEAELQRARAYQGYKQLTSRERQIAVRLIDQPSDSTSKMIARSLDISPRTVDHHRSRILDKMAVRSIAELVDLAGKTKVFDEYRKNESGDD